MARSIFVSRRFWREDDDRREYRRSLRHGAKRALRDELDSLESEEAYGEEGGGREEDRDED